MRLFLFVLMLPLTVVASPWNYYPGNGDMSVASISSAFIGTAQLSGPATAFTRVNVINNSNFAFEVNCTSVTEPSSNAATSFYVPPNSTMNTPWDAFLPYPLGKLCWIRASGSPATSGTFEIVGWGY